MNITQKLLAIQLELKAPKNQKNKFGNYNYRSAEDILEAIKPYAEKHSVLFKITEKLSNIKDMVCVVSTAKCIDVETLESIESDASAIIDFDAKGMQMPQRTGAASSYAKKYALGNLLLLDDTKDSDATNSHGKGSPKPASKTIDRVVGLSKNLPIMNNKHDKYNQVLRYLEKGGDSKVVMNKYIIEDTVLNNLINKQQ